MACSAAPPAAARDAGGVRTRPETNPYRATSTAMRSRILAFVATR